MPVPDRPLPGFALPDAVRVLQVSVVPVTASLRVGFEAVALIDPPGCTVQVPEAPPFGEAAPRPAVRARAAAETGTAPMSLCIRMESSLPGYTWADRPAHFRYWIGKPGG